jgi:hypothetical protein
MNLLGKILIGFLAINAVICMDYLPKKAGREDLRLSTAFQNHILPEFIRFWEWIGQVWAHITSFLDIIYKEIKAYIDSAFDLIKVTVQMATSPIHFFKGYYDEVMKMKWSWPLQILGWVLLVCVIMAAVWFIAPNYTRPVIRRILSSFSFITNQLQEYRNSFGSLPPETETPESSASSVYRASLPLPHGPGVAQDESKWHVARGDEFVGTASSAVSKFFQNRGGSEIEKHD